MEQPYFFKVFKDDNGLLLMSAYLFQEASQFEFFLQNETNQLIEGSFEFMNGEASTFIPFTLQSGGTKQVNDLDIMYISKTGHCLLHIAGYQVQPKNRVYYAKGAFNV